MVGRSWRTGVPMRNCRWMLWSLLAVVLASPAWAQTVRVVEFDEAVARAVASNRSVAQAALAIERAEALLQQARSATRPTVSATVSSVTLDSDVRFDDRVSQPQTQVTFGAVASMPILAPARWAQLSQARLQRGIADLSVADVERQIAVAAAQAYLAVIAQRRQVEVTQRAVENARAHLDYSRKRREGGLGSRLNELRAEQSVSTDEARLENARLAVLRAQEALGVILAEPGPVDAGSEPPLEVPTDAVSVEAALTERADLRLQRAVREAAEKVLADSTRDLLPTGTVSFAPQYITPKGLFQPSASWRLTFSVTQPLYEGGLRASAKQSRAANVSQARLNIETLEIQVRADVRLAQAAVTSYARALEFARTAASRSSEVLTISSGAFELGATTNLEVIDAQRSARDAESVAVIAEDALRRARLDLLVALGRFPSKK
jgi:outer membrane protein TolC